MRRPAVRVLVAAVTIAATAPALAGSDPFDGVDAPNGAATGDAAPVAMDGVRDRMSGTPAADGFVRLAPEINDHAFAVLAPDVRDDGIFLEVTGGSTQPR